MSFIQNWHYDIREEQLVLNYNVFANFQCSLYSSSLEFPLCFQFNFNTLSTKLVYIGAVQNMCISFWSGVLATLKEKE